MTQHQPQSPSSLRALDREWYGDTQPEPAKKRKRLEAKPLSAHEREVAVLRWQESREVYILGEAVANYPGTLREAVLALVKQTDRLNCMIAGVAVPDTGDGTRDIEAPDWTGLTIGALQAKRITLCLGAKKAARFIEAGLLHDATRCCRDALDAAFGPGKGP